MNWWRYTRTASVSERRQRALREGEQLERRMAKSGRQRRPVTIEGRLIARSFWGKAWCENLESYRDYEYRLPRGRSYVRHGAVLDLDIGPGTLRAVVAGSRPDPYTVEIKIKPLASGAWARIKTRCAGEIGSLIELLEGRLSDRVMKLVTDRELGLFPKPGEIEMSCTCPDWATMCKHVAAVLYGTGARFDTQPELLFTLRNVDHGELIAEASHLEVPRSTRRRTIDAADLASVFGIELAAVPGKTAVSRKRPAGRPESPAVRSPNKTGRGRVTGRAKKKQRRAAER